MTTLPQEAPSLAGAPRRTPWRLALACLTALGGLSLAAPAAAQAPADETGAEEAVDDGEGQDAPAADDDAPDEQGAEAEDADVESGDVEGGDAEGGDAEGGDADGADAAPEPAQTAPAQPPAPATRPAAEIPPPMPPAERTSCGASAHAEAAQAVVRVRSGGEWAAGFAYHSPSHVVTAWSAINQGRGVTVYTRDGTRYETQLLARDEQLDLAVLVTSEPLEGVEPLEPAPESSAMLGREVVAIGHPFFGANRLLGTRGEGLLRWSIAVGHVGAANETGVQADVALTADHTGGPLLDCQGRVLGMVTGAGLLSADLGLVARASRADQLIAQAGEPEDFLGNLRLNLGLGAGLIIDESGDAAGGFYLTLGAVLFDRISWMNRVGLFTGGIDAPRGSVLEHSRDIVRIETLLGYRFFVDLFGLTSLYIVPAGGITVMNQRASRRRVTVRPGCDPAVESCVEIVEDEDYATIAGGNSLFPPGTDEWVVRPAAGLTFLLGDNFEIGYTLELDFQTEEVETYHAVRAGFLL